MMEEKGLEETGFLQMVESSAGVFLVVAVLVIVAVVGLLVLGASLF